MIIKKIARFLIYFLCACILLVVIAQVTFNHYINKRIILYLQTQVTEVSHGTYSLQLENIELSLIGRSLVFNKLKFTPTGACANCLETQYGITADDVKLEGLGIIAYLEDRQAIAENVEFGNLAISIYQGTRMLPEKSRDSLKITSFSIYRAMSKKLDALTIHTIDINNAKIRMYRNGTEQIFSSEKNYIDIKNFTINKTVEQLNRLFLADTFNVSMKTFSYQMGKGMYTLLGRNMNASYTDSVLTIDSLTLAPNYDKKTFGKMAGKQVSRTDLHTGKISFTKMDVKLFIEHNWFVAKKLDIDNLLVYVFRDKNIQFKHEKKPSMQLLIRKIPFFISVDSIGVHNANITYDDLEPGAPKAGSISFNRLNASIIGLQNDTGIYTENSNLKLKATAYFMNQGKLDAYYCFALSSPKEVFTCSGKLYEMDLNAVNPMLENSAHIHVKNGKVDSLVFSFDANDVNSKGSMKFMYHNLEVELLDRTDQGQDPKHQLLTFIAKQFIINEQNPSKGKPVRITPIYFPRDPNRFFFYYTWKSLQSAIMPAIGLPKGFKMNKKT
ncbi:MAG: hypothetical protein JWP12_3537 [Bacteroidetes bacterium]|nr:hypothetical protein [Bacteroidota bacterium]